MSKKKPKMTRGDVWELMRAHKRMNTIGNLIPHLKASAEVGDCYITVEVKIHEQGRTTLSPTHIPISRDRALEALDSEWADLSSLLFSAPIEITESTT